MKSSTLRIILLVSAALITVIICIQLYWLNMIYSLEQKNFNTDVTKSIKGFYEDMGWNEDSGFNISNDIERPNDFTFLIRIDTLCCIDTMESRLSYELQDFNVFANFDFAVYSDSAQHYIYKSHFASPASRPINEKGMQLTEFNRNYDYIALHFPHRYRYIIKEILWWILGTVLLLVVLVSFGFIMYFFYRQKFLNELQKDFVNNFTHEFKTPLSVMKIATDVLVQPAIQQQPDRLKKYASIIGEQVSSLQNKTDRLLQTVKTDSTQLVLDIEPVNLNEIIRKAIDNMDPLIREKNAQVEFEPLDDAAVIQGDRLHLTMLMVNLIENAIKYSAKPHILIELKRENGHYLLKVKDNGVGIDKQYQRKIFKKFFRVPTGDVHNVKGFGLGLNYVKRIVEEHNGKIEVNSILGIGTEFIITLPK